MKNKSLIITLIVILGLFALTLTGVFIYILVKGNNFNFNFNFKGANMKLIDSYETIDTSKIYFNLLSTDLEIKESKNEKVLVEYYSNQEKNAKIEYKNNTIKIDEENYNLSCFGICNVKRKIVLYIPVSNNSEIEIKTKSGDIKSDINLININISTMSGDVALKSIENVNISTMSGDLVIDEVSNKMTLKTVSGDILVRTLNIKENSNINTVSGDVVITNNEVNSYIEVSTISGDKLIQKSDRKSDIVLNIKTTSGDISVN